MSEIFLEMARLFVQLFSYDVRDCKMRAFNGNKPQIEARPLNRTSQYIITVKRQVYKNKTPYTLMDYCYAYQYLGIHRPENNRSN